MTAQNTTGPRPLAEGPLNVARVTPVPGLAVLVTDRGTGPTYTGNREVDARTALARGVKDYLTQLSISWEGGRSLQFEQVYANWAEPEDEAVYPSAFVHMPAGSIYDASNLTPKLDGQLKLPDGRFLVKTSEMTCDLEVEVWATDSVERAALIAMLEDAFAPTLFSYGFRLLLPYYFGELAEFAMASMTYVDSEDAARQRFRKAVFTLKAGIPVIRLQSIPTMQTRVPVSVGTAPLGD